MRSKHSVVVMALLISVWVALAFGCSPAKVTVLLSADAAQDKNAHQPNGGIPLEDILSLRIALKSIVLARVGDEGEADEGEANGAPGEDDDDYLSKIPVFTGDLDMELRDLVGISELISSAAVPAGTYNKIWLTIDNPRLILVANPDEVITDIHLTANSRLFFHSEFTIPAAEPSIILLDFQGLHLVRTGQGKLVWTPRLRGNVSVEPARVMIQGRIESVDTASKTIQVRPDSGAGIVPVQYANARIFLPVDTDTPTGSEADLKVNTPIVIEGTLDATGAATAENIWILAPDA